MLRADTVTRLAFSELFHFPKIDPQVEFENLLRDLAPKPHLKAKLPAIFLFIYLILVSGWECKAGGALNEEEMY